jgi:hypothetical protein
MDDEQDQFDQPDESDQFERRDRFDPTQAMFSAMSSFWWRLVSLFGLCLFGHHIGTNCAEAGEYLERLWSEGPRAILDLHNLDPIRVLFSWVGALYEGLHDGWGFLQLVALAIAFLFVWLSDEDRFVHGFAIVSITQPIESFFVDKPSNDIHFLLGLVMLIIWVGSVGFLYRWWLKRWNSLPEP